MSCNKLVNREKQIIMDINGVIMSNKKPTLKEIKTDAKSHGIEIKKSKSHLNGSEAWELSNGRIMTRRMLETCYFACDYNYS